MNATPDHFPMRGHGSVGRLGPLIGIGLPPGLAARLAGPRPVLSLDPEQIAQSGLDRLTDAVVACLLLGSQMDAIDVIAQLRVAGYRGQVTVVAPPMPNPRMVERELVQLAPSMQVQLVVL
jgi:alkanesulfonate monooxygenase SsuD/methylene tetrahydromethanopterin reductase-like flavin-dependent oxidoreductase (luciferase family)